METDAEINLLRSQIRTLREEYDPLNRRLMLNSDERQIKAILGTKIYALTNKLNNIYMMMQSAQHT